MVTLSPEEIQKHNDKYYQESRQQFEQFRTDIRKNKCPICGHDIKYFNEKYPCLHWLLLPRGFQKKHLPVINSEFGHERMQSFLRWYVNSFKLFKGINDLKEEHSKGKIIAVTIKHKKVEWSFDISKSDLEGHGEWPPHYHFQIRINDRRYITFGEFHLPLSDYDIWCINVRLNKIPGVRYKEYFGASVEGILANDLIDTKKLLDAMRSTDKENDAPFSISTIIEAEPGHQISGDDLAKIIQEHNKTGKSMASLISNLKNVKTNIIISPGEGIPSAAERNIKRRKKKDNV